MVLESSEGGCSEQPVLYCTCADEGSPHRISNSGLENEIQIGAKLSYLLLLRDLAKMEMNISICNRLLFVLSLLSLSRLMFALVVTKRFCNHSSSLVLMVLYMQISLSSVCLHSRLRGT